MEDLIVESLSSRTTATGYLVSRGLARLFPDMTCVEGNAGVFDIEGFAHAGLCTLEEQSVPRSRRVAFWTGPEHGTIDRPDATFFEVDWEGEKLSVLVLHWPEAQRQPYHYFILADTRAIAVAFHEAVCAWATPEPDEYILVFDVGGWNKDEALLAAIQGTTLDQVVLDGTLKEDILHDLTSFFGARDTYAEYGVPWKRGILFLGPPGNGKTHATKAFINTLGQRCVYVKTFSRGMPDQFAIRAVFDRARQIAPCLVVLEDLDSLITPENRSYFLNELDGFAGNDGILILATTNHPERLDPAILDRPSRFDRKYPFNLPGLTERETYIRHWNATLRPALRLSDDMVEAIAESTDDFSFAYLKELFLSAMMRWMVEAQPGTMNRIMAEQVNVLGDQMATVMALLGDGDMPPPHPMHHGRHPPQVWNRQQGAPEIPL